MSAQPRNPKHTPGSSPPRRPLHSRSESDINIAQGNVAASTPEKRARKPKQTGSNVFPTLPSQILSPSDQARNDQDNNGAGRRVLADRSPNRSPRRRRSKEKARRSIPSQYSRTETMSTDMWQFDPAQPDPSLQFDSAGRPSGSLVHYMRQRYEQAEAKARLSQFSFERHRSLKSPPGSPRSQRAELVTLAPSVAEDADTASESPTVHTAMPLPLARPEIPVAIPERSLQRPLSASTIATARSEMQSPDDDLALRRSFSNPAAHTDAFLETLLQGADTESVAQFQRMKRPSYSTMASDSSSVRRAYPAPLRLRKKKGDSQLARKAAIQATNASGRASQSLRNQRSQRLRPSRSNLSAASSAQWATEFESERSRPTSLQENDPNALRWSRNWADELDDVVAELSPNPLRHQGSFYYESAAGSLVSLDESLAPRDSFYYWFNDSHVRWAKSFYRGGGALPLESPPSVTVIEPIHFIETPHGSRSNSSHGSAPTDSPASVGFPDQIYIPRSRPLLRPRDFSQQHRHTSLDEGSDLEWEDVESSPYLQDDRGSGTFSDVSVTPRLPKKIVLDHPKPFQPAHLPSSDYDQPESAKPRVTSSIASSSRSSMEIRPVGAGDGVGPSSPTAETPVNQPQQAYLPKTKRFSKRSLRRNGPILHYRQPSLNQRSTFTWAMPNSVAPRLCLDRSAGDALPVWSAPSMDDQPGPLNKLNRQIWLFFIGFFFPLAWMVAAVLPLPPRPSWRRPDRSDLENGPESKEGDAEVDLFDTYEVWRYRKARWWRITNRFMSFTGLCVIAAIIVCTVIGTR